MNLLFDIKTWIILALILGLVLGFDHPDASTLLMITLLIQMTLALQGLRFDFSDLKKYRTGTILCLLCSFGFNTAITLLTGLLFIEDTALWYGWIMLSAVPCAISVMTMTFYMKGDLKLGLFGFSAIYVVALAFVPLLTHLLMGDAVSPLKILEYVVLFVVCPMVIDIPLNRITIPPKVKVIMMNIVIFAMVFISVGFRRDYIVSNPDVAFLILLANLVRIFVPSLLLIFILRKLMVDRGRSIVYIAMCTWRNSGLATTLCIIMLGSTYPDALLPGVLSLLVENLWFIIMQGTFDRMWPKEEGAVAC